VIMAVNGHTNGVNSATSTGALCSVDDLVSQKYDFVVVGGGTAGLAVAIRLTEDPNVTVAVLEAGEDRMNDKAVSTPSMYPTLVCKSRSRAMQN
jgi:choline dehydrogenase-like flavoprotein